MKKLCISLSAALIITVAAGSAPSIRAEGFGFFLPSQSVKEHDGSDNDTIKIVRPKHLEFSFAIGELIERLFG